MVNLKEKRAILVVNCMIWSFIVDCVILWYDNGGISGATKNNKSVQKQNKIVAKVESWKMAKCNESQKLAKGQEYIYMNNDLTKEEQLKQKEIRSIGKEETQKYNRIKMGY